MTKAVTPTSAHGRVRVVDMRAFVDAVADMTKDGECLAHGPTCDLDSNECEAFDLTNDDAVDTLHSLISKARGLSYVDE